MRGVIRGWAALGMLAMGAASHAETHLIPSLKLGAEERYDDDALLRNSRGAGQLMTKLSPQVGLQLEDHTITTTAWYAADLLFRHGSGTTALDHRGALSLKKAFSRRLVLDAAVNIWRVSDPTSLPRLGMARTLSPILYVKGGFSTRWSVTERFSVRPGYLLEAAKIYETDRATGFVHSPFVESWYRATRRTDLGLDYRFQYFSFGPATADAHGIFGGYRYRLTRHTVFTAKAGPIWFHEHARGGRKGFLPRVSLEIAQELTRLELAAVVGHDLVGASGFTTTLWADFASVLGSYRIFEPVKLFAGASYFRNGRAPNVELFNFNSRAPGTAQGYAVGGGIEWEVNRVASVRAAFDRYAQLAGADQVAGVDLTRNIASIRLVLTAL
jgi:hypothetical protein